MSRLGTHYDCGSVDEDLERAEGCYKLLLDADSDLTSVIFRKDDAGYYWSNAFSEALTQESLVSYACNDLVSTISLTMVRSS